jgi:L-ascorbate metabolism protein UlaG (beta-lactamase superfamily)
MLLLILSLLVMLVVLVYAFMQQPIFGKTATGERLEKHKKSANYKNGSFSNISPTPQLTEGAGFISVMKEFLFEKNKRSTPKDILPSQKTDLLKLDPHKNVLVWFGHSSYFMQIDGKRILVDPVFSGSASPIATTKSFKGSDVYTVDELPVIDYLFISHDHYDHLDYKTIKKLKPKIKLLICGLGTGAHFERWGFDDERIIERDWNVKIQLDPGFTIYTAPSRHFSGRNFNRNKSLWTSFVLQSPAMKIFIGGDSGYDSHFAEIGQQHGPFDLAILECGQYDKSWKYIHMMPAEVLQASEDLKAARLMPVHWGKFSLANHAWDDPIRSIIELNKEKNIPLITPMIGEAVDLKDGEQVFSEWWTTIN